MPCFDTLGSRRCLWTGIAPRAGCSYFRLAHRPVSAQSGQGFGTQTAEPKPKQEKKQKLQKLRRGKGQQGNRSPYRNQAPQQLRPSVVQQQGQQQPEPPDLEFEARVRGLKQKAADLKAALPAQQQAERPLDLYENPPPLTQTLFGKATEADGKGPLGNRIALTVGSLLLVVIFLLASGVGDIVAGPGTQAPQQARQLPPEKQQELQKQAEGFEAQLREKPDDLQAAKRAAVTYSLLGDAKKAESQLVKLTAASGEDAEAWRLLAETRMQLAKPADAAAAYERVMELEPSIDELQGVAGAHVAAGHPERAVAAVEAAQQRIGGDADALRSASEDTGLGEVELKLLLGRVYAKWKGHDGQALAQYDSIIQQHPDDFRGFFGTVQPLLSHRRGHLARGVLLRDAGRRGDARRAFIQAQSLAPKAAQDLVNSIIGPIK